MFTIETLPNGIRLICEYIEHVPSAALGYFVGHGTRYEPEEMAGVSHAIEHMLFKGTETRSAEQIAMEIDAIGGHINAYTTKENTCYHVQALGAHMPVAIELLSDIFLNASFHEEAWEIERGVINEEISMYEDLPDDLCFQKLYQTVLDGPLAHAVLGKRETLAAIGAAEMKAYKEREYRPGDIVVSLAGHFTQAHKEQIIQALSVLRPSEKPERIPSTYKPGFVTYEKQVEQNHLCFAFPGLPAGHPDRFAASILDSVLGGGMSSRLFQSVREREGLCYAVYAFWAAHLDLGVNGVYTALGKQTEEKAIRLILDEIHKIKREGITISELERVREQIKANTLISQESTAGRMSYLGSRLLTDGKVQTTQEIVAAIDAVTREQVAELANRLLDTDKISFAAVGQVESVEHYRNLICTQSSDTRCSSAV